MTIIIILLFLLVSYVINIKTAQKVCNIGSSDTLLGACLLSFRLCPTMKYMKWLLGLIKLDKSVLAGRGNPMGQGFRLRSEILGGMAIHSDLLMFVLAIPCVFHAPNCFVLENPSVWAGNRYPVQP